MAIFSLGAEWMGGGWVGAAWAFFLLESNGLRGVGWEQHGHFSLGAEWMKWEGVGAAWAFFSCSRRDEGVGGGGAAWAAFTVSILSVKNKTPCHRVAFSIFFLS